MIVKQRSCIKGKVMMIFLFFPESIGFDMSCELSPTETVCMDCQTLFFVVFFFVGVGEG